MTPPEVEDALAAAEDLRLGFDSRVWVSRRPDDGARRDPLASGVSRS